MYDLGNLFNIYWRIRYHCNKSRKRKYYRYAFKEKQLLLAQGMDKEELRLLCRTLSRRYNDDAERRLAQYLETRKKDLISF
jgi:hypothetical protein